jgi:hypothetical protein
MMTGPIPPSPEAQTDADPPTGPIGVVANVIGICAAGVALFTPAVAFAQLGAMGAAGFILALAAGHRESRTPVFGLLGGLAAMMAAVALHGQYQDAIDQLGQFGGL